MSQKFSILFFIFFLGVPALLEASAPFVSNIKLDVISKSHTADEVRAILPLLPGDPYTPEKLDKAREMLLKTGLFEKITVTPRQTGNQVFIHYELVEALHIRKVYISGNYPYLARKITRLSYLQEGSPFKEEYIAQSEQRIQEFFEKEGFYGTQVTLIPTIDKKYKAVNLKIKIKKGKTIPLGKTEVTGNHTYLSDTEIHRRLFSYHKFKLRRLTHRVRRLEQKLVSDGFVRARVKLVSATLNPETKRVDVTVDIEERKKLILSFAGNKRFKGSTLKDHVLYGKERSYDRIATERSIDRLKSFYNINGFINPLITAAIDESATEVNVTFTIQEGPRTRLKSVEFEGNHVFSDRKLAKQMEMKTHTLFRQGFFQLEPIPTDIQKIEDFYHTHGFFEAKATDWYYTLNAYGDQATLHITVNENTPYHVDHLSVAGNSIFTAQQILKKGNFKKGYNESRLNRARDKITAAYLEKGYPYAEVSWKADADGNILFQINEKSKVVIDKIVLTGSYTSKEAFILDTLKIKEGDIYTYKKILNAQLNLRRLGIFDYARVAPVGLEEERDKVSLLVFVQERKSITLDLQARYDSDKQFSGEVLLTKRNLFGTAKQIQIRGIGGFQLSRGEVTLFAPRIYGASWNLVNQYFVQYEDDANFNASSYGASLGTLKNFGPDWSILLKDQFTHFNTFEGQSNQTALAKNLFDSSFSELTTSVAYDTRDNYSDPQKGLFTTFSSELDTDLADFSNNFDILRLSASNYRGLGKRFTFINSLRLGKLFRITNAPHIPVQKLFFMGGNDTVRGFAQDAINPSGGTTSLLYNSELHFRLFDGFKVAGFFDAGSLTEQFSEISSQSIRESAGVGLRYFTPVGPIRVDWGFILDRRPGEPLQRFHLSFGYFF